MFHVRAFYKLEYKMNIKHFYKLELHVESRCGSIVKLMWRRLLSSLTKLLNKVDDSLISRDYFMGVDWLHMNCSRRVANGAAKNRKKSHRQSTNPNLSISVRGDESLNGLE